MARQKKKQKKNRALIASEDLTPRLLWHFSALGVHSVDGYLTWCRENGYEARLNKTTRMLRRELDEWRRRTAIEALARARRVRDPAGTLVGVCRGRLEGKDVPKHLQSAAERIETLPTDSAYRATLADMLQTVARRTDFLLESRRFGARNYPYLDALISMHERRRSWIRPLDAFRPRTHNRERQFAELARHLFTRYPVPAFLDAAWFRRDDAATSMRDWFLHIGHGQSLRTADTPIPVTRRIAHYFCFAPAEVTIEGALRWGQIHALGGDAALAHAVLQTPIGTSLEHDEFWTSVLRFFVAQADLVTIEVAPILDYIRHQKFEPLEVVHASGRIGERPPPRPHFSMRNRTLRALRSEVTRWHRLLAKATGGAAVWAPCGILPYCEKTGSTGRGNLKIWRIEELRSSGALAYEGRLMRHCVASYAVGCARGAYSIWALSREAEGITRRIQTIQVSKYKSILQCRGKHNKPPSEAVIKVIRRWATREGIATHVLY